MRPIRLWEKAAKMAQANDLRLVLVLIVAVQCVLAKNSVDQWRRLLAQTLARAMCAFERMALVSQEYVAKLGKAQRAAEETLEMSVCHFFAILFMETFQRLPQVSSKVCRMS